MIYLKYFLVFECLMVNAVFIEDIQSLFDKKNCIEASLLSISQSQDAASVMLDKSTTITVNTSEINKIKFNKSDTTKINELAQYNEITYTYELISEEGPAHSKNYKIILKLGDEKYEGTGSSLKKAQQAAAFSALQNTYYQHPPVKLKSDEKPLTPTVVLNNVATKLGIGVSYFLLNGKEEKAIASYGSNTEAYGKSKSFSQKWNQTSNSFRIPTEEAQVSGPFSVKVKVGDSQYVGFGHTIQAARHDAATQAIKNLEKQVLNNVCTSEESIEECKQRKEDLKSPVSRIYEASQRHNLPLEFLILSESGKSHQKTFITQCKLGDFTSEGEANSKKESKRKAAENMLENLSQLPEIVDGKQIINALSNKKKKRKKNKIIKNNHIFGQDLSNVLSSFWSVEDSPTDANAKPKFGSDSPSHVKLKLNSGSAKDMLLEVGNMLGVEVQFMDLNEYGDLFYTLVTLMGMHPDHICLGKAVTREKSHESGALHGLRFLHKFGLLDKAKLSQYQDESLFFEDFRLDEEESFEKFVEDLERKD